MNDNRSSDATSADLRPLPTSWARAFLPLAILACLEARPLHGYAITQELDTRGLGRPTGGSLYPVLGRLEQAGEVTTRWVEGDSGPGRKQYTITSAGRARLSRDRAALARVAATLDAVADPPHPTPEDPR